MKRLLAFGILPLLIAGVWAAAIWWPIPVDPLPARFVGTFRLYRFEPPDGVLMSNPYVKGHRWYYTFRSDGSYEVLVKIPGEYEMNRTSGIVRIGEGNSLTLDQVAGNRGEEPTVYRYGTIWDHDKEGREVLVLTHVEEGYHLYLRRTDETP